MEMRIFPLKPWGMRLGGGKDVERLREVCRNKIFCADRSMLRKRVHTAKLRFALPVNGSTGYEPVYDPFLAE